MEKRFNKQKFYEFIIENHVIEFYPEAVKLKSNRYSPYYINWRNITNDVFLLDILTDHILSWIEDLDMEVECFFGVPEGATKLGIILQYKWARSQNDYKPGRYVLPMGRGRPKDHGNPKDKYFIGIPQGKTVVIEDVLTTGESLEKTINNLLKAGVQVSSALVLTDRNERRSDGKIPKNVIEEMGIPYYSMSNLSELLPEVFERYELSPELKKAVKEYFEKYVGV